MTTGERGRSANSHAARLGALFISQENAMSTPAFPPRPTRRPSAEP